MIKLFYSSNKLLLALWIFFKIALPILYNQSKLLVVATGGLSDSMLLKYINKKLNLQKKNKKISVTMKVLIFLC